MHEQSKKTTKVYSALICEEDLFNLQMKTNLHTCIFNKFSPTFLIVGNFTAQLTMNSSGATLLLDKSCLNQYLVHTDNALLESAGVILILKFYHRHYWAKGLFMTNLLSESWEDSHLWKTSSFGFSKGGSLTQFWLYRVICFFDWYVYSCIQSAVWGCEYFRTINHMIQVISSNRLFNEVSTINVPKFS